MRKKALLLAGIMMLSLAGCGNKPAPAAEPAKEQVVKEEAKAPAEEVKEESKEAAEEANAKAKEETVQEAAEAAPGEVLYYDRKAGVGPGNGFFAEMHDRVYFHVPDADAMGNTSLMGEYMYNDTGLTVLLSCNLAGGDVRTEHYDHAMGTMGRLGEGLSYMGILYGEDMVQCLDLFDGKSDPDAALEQAAGKIYYNLGTTSDGAYAVGLGYDMASSVLKVVDAAHNEVDYTPDSYIEFAGYSGHELFYIAGEYGSDMQFTLRSIDLETGEEKDYGVLPGEEHGNYSGSVDEFASDGEKVYMTYSFYEGTGYFFAGGYYVQAVIGEENSVTSEEMPWGEEDPYVDPSWVPFYVEGGVMLPTEGVPGTGGIRYADGIVGYYDEKGAFVPVADGYVYEYSEEQMENLEICEKVGDALYLVHNMNIRNAEDDIGWRYAYYRDHSDVLRVDVNTGEEKLVHHAVGPWG